MRAGFGLSAGCYSPWLPEERGTPLAPGGLGRPPRRQPPASSASQQLRGSARFHGKRTDGPARARGAQPARLPACRRRVFSARNWRVLRRATGAFRRTTGGSPGAQPARLPARNRRVSRRVFRRATGASCDAQPARLPARNRRVSRRVFRRATGASCDASSGASSGAQPARLPARTRRVCRRAPSASNGAQSARLCGVRSICILNRFVLTLVLLL